MASLYKRSNSPFWWLSIYQEGCEYRFSLRVREREAAERIRDRIGERVKLSDHELERLRASRLLGLPSERKTATGHVYLIRAKYDVFKIGYTSSHPEERLAVIQRGTPDELELLAAFPGTISEEQVVLSMFDEHRLRGEWFMLPPQLAESLVSAFKALKAAPVPPPSLQPPRS